jgi:hypothetical protein
MNAREAIRLSIEGGNMITMAYLNDLTDAEFMKRPCPGCNHINWQVGHLIAAEHMMVDKVLPGSMPKLPEGFEAKYSKEATTSDDAKKFCTKSELMNAYEKQRAGTLAALEKLSDADLDKPTGLDYAPTVGAVFSIQGGHWMMHAGQWVVVRRQLGRAPLF